MPFTNGPVSFKRFKVVGGQSPAAPSQDLLDKLKEHALRSTEVGIPEEIEYGWSGGRHLYDGEFSFENNVYADSIFFSLRIDTNKIPGEVKRSLLRMEEDAIAAGNPSGFISKAQKRDAKETVRKKIEEEQRSRKYLRSKSIPVLWNFADGVVYCASSGESQECLAEIFERTFGLMIAPISPSLLAAGSTDESSFNDIRPTRFAIGPDGTGSHPEYPWVSKSTEPKTFLGNEFLLWLMFKAISANEIRTATQNISVYFDRFVAVECAYGQTGKDVITGVDPTRSPEFKQAMFIGKVPRKAGVEVVIGRNAFTFTLNPETFGFSGTKLPDVKEAETPRVLFEERIKLLRELVAGFDELFAAFLSNRTTSEWTERTAEMVKWIKSAAA